MDMAHYTGMSDMCNDSMCNSGRVIDRANRDCGWMWTRHELFAICICLNRSEMDTVQVAQLLRQYNSLVDDTAERKV